MTVLDPPIRARVDALVGVGVHTGDAIGIAVHEQQQKGPTMTEGYDYGEAYVTDPPARDADRPVEYDEDEGRER